VEAGLRICTFIVGGGRRAEAQRSKICRRAGGQNFAQLWLCMINYNKSKYVRNNKLNDSGLDLDPTNNEK